MHLSTNGKYSDEKYLHDKSWHLVDNVTGAIVLTHTEGHPVGIECVLGAIIFHTHPYQSQISRLINVKRVVGYPPPKPYGNYITLKQLEDSGRMRPKSTEELARDAKLAELYKRLGDQISKALSSAPTERPETRS